jgi:Flp pilus assembly protein TadG
MNSSGAVAMMTAAAAVILVGAAGLALDTTRAWVVEARMKTALDAASLVAARRIDQPTRDAEARAIFWANFEQGSRTRSYLGATIAEPTIAVEPNDATRVRVSTSAQVPTTLFNVIARRQFRVADSAVAQRLGTGLELALVIDQTSSMGDPASGGGTKLDAVKAAVTTLLNILYGSQDTQRNLWVSVVPFARSINIGTANSAMVDFSASPPGFTQALWNGCVEARPNGNDITDVAPTGTGRFRPYAWPSTFRLVGTVEGGRCISTNAYAAVNGLRHCHGDNDWGHSGNGGGPTLSALGGNYMYSFLRGEGMTQAQSVGPGILCALNAIQPLTASRATVEARVNAIQTPPRSGGTTVPVGLQGAWYTLSPNWQNQWQPNPNAAIPSTPTLPLAYGTPNMRKVVVLLSDGDNNWQTAYASGGSCGSTSGRSVCSSASGTELIYNAYGRVAATNTLSWNARFPSSLISPVSQTNADSRLDQRTATLCTAMKQAPRNIVIYVIGFEVSSSTHRTMLQNCATSAAHYFESPSTAELQAVFSTIANQLSSLRLVE